MRVIKAAIAVLLAMTQLSGLALAQSEHPAFTAGQVWQYHARPEDTASLLKIQAVEDDPNLTKNGPIYHVSIIGVHLGRDRRLGEIGHVPVSNEMLAKSVTVLVKSDAKFPDATLGVANWKAAKGGVFTIPMAEIVGVIDGMAQGRAGG